MSSTPGTRPNSYFDLFSFFSIFLPGLATLMGLYMLIPRDLSVSLGTAIIPIFLLAFVFGEGLHSLAVAVERVFDRLYDLIPYDNKILQDVFLSHRYRFAREVHNPTIHDQEVVQQFCKDCSETFGEVDVTCDGDSGVAGTQSVYPLVQSYVYADKRGRSRILQAIYAFCRSMLLLLSGLPILYASHAVLRNMNWIDRLPKYVEFFPQGYSAFIEAALPLCWLGAIVFFYGTWRYKEFFVEYLITDFIVLRRDP